MNQKEFLAKVFTNKNNNQMSIVIPKKQIVFDKIPKELKVKIRW